MEKEGTKIQPRPKEKDSFLNFAVWGLIVWAFVTMSLNIIMLHDLTSWSSIIFTRSDSRIEFLYETNSSEIVEPIKVGDETREMEKAEVLDRNENEVPAKMIRSRKMVRVAEITRI